MRRESGDHQGRLVALCCDTGQIPRLQFMGLVEMVALGAGMGGREGAADG